MWWTLSLVGSAIGVGGDGVAEVREGMEGIERALGGAVTVEVKGIPERMLERMPTQSVAVRESGAAEESMRVKVERIIDGKEDVVMVEEPERNPKSRRVESDLVDEQIVQEGDRNPKSRRMEYDSGEEQAVQREQREQITLEDPAIQDEEQTTHKDGNPKPKRIEHHPEEEQVLQREQIIPEEPAEQVILEEPAAHERTVQGSESSLRSREMEYGLKEEQAVQAKPVEKPVKKVTQGEKVFEEEDRNPKSRRMSYNLMEESGVLKELPVVELSVDTRESSEATHDEL